MPLYELVRKHTFSAGRADYFFMGLGPGRSHPYPIGFVIGFVFAHSPMKAERERVVKRHLAYLERGMYSTETLRTYPLPPFDKAQGKDQW